MRRASATRRDADRGRARATRADPRRLLDDRAAVECMEACWLQNQRRCHRHQSTRRSETSRHSVISSDISNHLRSREFPAFVDEPRQMPVERDRAAIAHPGRTHPHHRAPQHPSANARAIGFGLDLQFDGRSRKQAMVGLDQRAPGARRRSAAPVSGPYRRRDDAVLVERLQTRACRGDRATSPLITVSISLSSGSNFNIRVLPVSPKMRTAYCASRRPRM